MADYNHFVPGDFYRICDRSGLKVRSRRAPMEWNGLIVSDRFIEQRQPQDFVKGTIDNQTVPYPRPRTANQFVGPLTTTLSANVPAGGTVLPVASSVRMLTGDIINVMLDIGEQFRTQIFNVTSGTSITCSPALPSAASSGNLVTNISAVAPAKIG